MYEVTLNGNTDKHSDKPKFYLNTVLKYMKLVTIHHHITRNPASCLANSHLFHS